MKIVIEIEFEMLFMILTISTFLLILLKYHDQKLWQNINIVTKTIPLASMVKNVALQTNIT